MKSLLLPILILSFVLSTMACQNRHLSNQDLDPAPSNSTNNTNNDQGSSPSADLSPNSYPIRLGYVNKIQHWWGDNIAKDLGVPGYAPAHDYNYMLLAFWKCHGNPLDIALMWESAYNYFGGANSLGGTTQEIQEKIRKKFNDAGVKLLVSAFGGTEHPTSAGQDPKECGHKLGSFILNNNLDGVDIDWEDNAAMEAGTGESWVITFTRALREVIPNHIVIHAPQAPYFKEEYYKNGAYITINREVGHLINFYMVQFYNQGNTPYDSYEQLFTKATGNFNGTSVKEIAARGIPLSKIVVGKPVVQTDAANTGYVCQEDLGVWAARAYDELGWFAGIGHWQYPSDKTGQSISLASKALKNKCQTNHNCQ